MVCPFVVSFRMRAYERSKERIDKRGGRGAVGEEHQYAYQHQKRDHRNQPPQAASPKKIEKISYEAKKFLWHHRIHSLTNCL